jgi:co-chaperonin GroES (HSP10)
MLKPLGNRILVQPDAPAESTDSGLVLPQDRDHVPMSGTVVAVGNGPARDAKIRAAAIKRCISMVEDVDEVAALRAYLAQAETFEHAIAVGDRVAYPIECGSVLTEDGVSYIVLNEDDVVVLVTEQEAAA